MEDFEFIKEYENLYKINKNGDIYSCWYKKVMTPLTSKDGYKYVSLKKEGKRYKGFIHRLLGKQYIENPDNKPEIDHINRDKNDNSLQNLRWVSRVENRKNRDDIIENLTEEQKEERKIKIRERARIWAEKDRRNKGCKIRNKQ